MGKNIGEHIKITRIERDSLGGPEPPAGDYMVNSIVFGDQAELDDAMSKADTARNNIPILQIL
mgnify:CR=1 FL=1